MHEQEFKAYLARQYPAHTNIPAKSRIRGHLPCVQHGCVGAIYIGPSIVFH
jgi:hypothetical protein